MSYSKEFTVCSGPDSSSRDFALGRVNLQCEAACGPALLLDCVHEWVETCQCAVLRICVGSRVIWAMELHQAVPVLSLRLLTKLDHHLSSTSSLSSNDGEFIPCPGKLAQCLFICAVKSWPFFWFVWFCLLLRIHWTVSPWSSACRSFTCCLFPSLDPEFSALVAEGPTDREGAGPWGGKRSSVSSTGHRGWGGWGTAAGSGGRAGPGHGKEGFKAVRTGES